MLQCPVRKELHPASFLPYQARLEEQVRFHDGISWEPVEVFHMDDRIRSSEKIAKTSFGKAPLKRHLSTLEPRLRAPAGTGVLSLVAFASGLAVARTHAPSYPFSFFPRSLWRFQFSQIHSYPLFDHSITSTKWLTRRTIPRTSGRSGRTKV